MKEIFLLITFSILSFSALSREESKLAQTEVIQKTYSCTTCVLEEPLIMDDHLQGVADAKRKIKIISEQLRKYNEEVKAKTIENKLIQLRADRAATNKQVFALLVMDRFVGEQSTDFFKGNASSTGFSDIAKSSVSQFLSAALDELASDLFKGINVDLNLNSYKDFIVNDGRKKNDLGVEVSKNFLNDRLSVTVGRTYGIESQDGSAKAAQQKGSRFLPDVTVNYKLSKDGKYMLRSYNKDQFEVILDGYVVETGVAFIVTMDYDKYKELFMKKNK